MATYQELRARSQQVRDEQNIGGNTALRVGQLLMDIVKYFYDNDAAASEYLQQHFAMVNDGTQLLNWQQSPIVILHTMGETYDEGDFSSLSQGENYYRAGFILEANGQGGGINGETPKANVLYVNLANDTLYTWNGSSFDAITTGGGGGSISGDDIIKNAYYSNGNLVLIIETESGDKTVTIPVTFDASNYVPTSRTVNGKALSNNITLSQSDIPGLVAALAAKVGYSDDEWLQVKAGAMQAATAVPNTTTVNGKQLNNNIVIGMSDIPGLLQAIANAGSGAVSVTTNQDGTFVIHVGETDYTINLNHTHEGMAKLVKCTEATLPQTLADDTIYVQVDNLTTPTEIEALHIFGLEFTGGGGAAPGVPYLSSPGANISMGDTENGSVTKVVKVKGRFLTQALSATLTGTGYAFGTTQPTGVTRNSDTSLTITADAAKAGVDIPVVYTGTAFNATGTLDIISSSPDSIDNESTLVANPATIENLAAVKLTGTQWMQTDYYPQANTRFELDCKFIKNGYSSTGTGTNRGKFLGCDNGASVFYFNNGAYYAMSNNTNKVFSLYAWTEHPYSEGGQIYSHDYGTEQAFCKRGVINYSNGSISFLGSTWATETRVSTSEHPLCIGYFNGEIYGNFDLEIYELKIYNGTTLVYDFKPVSKDGVYGLLDAASGTFISSQTNSPLIPIFLT